MNPEASAPAAPAAAGEPAGPALRALLPLYIEAMRVRNYAERTIETQQRLSRWFIEFCEERAVTLLPQVTRDLVERYQRHLYTMRTTRGRRRTDAPASAGSAGRPLAVRGQHNRLWAVVRFLRWCVRARHCAFSAAAELELPRLPQPLPRPALTVAEVERVMDQPDLATAAGLRDRAMLEVLYASGVRRGELVALTIDDLDREREVLRIREGKGKKGRIVPLSLRALRWLDRYLAEVWAAFPQALEHRRLFIGVEAHRPDQRGTPLAGQTVAAVLGGYLALAGITKPGAVHIFRHTAATLMMENGADPRAIQDFLGHADLKTTGIYTNVSFKFLKDQHRATHPSSWESPPA
jgi:integrase/recombinase XerD